MNHSTKTTKSAVKDNSSEDILENLSLFEKCKLAQDENTSISLLSELVREANIKVKEALLDNPCLPSFISYDLAKDESPDIRFELASNPYTTGGILRMLVNDENPYVASRAERTLERIKKEVNLNSRYRNQLIFLRESIERVAS